ncbi:MAG: hypothetical protein JW810_13900, partial [Sedimentisphaerales bacterium]|nr:hypothetical protein [Sedimentisphaerales bacterium]
VTGNLAAGAGGGIYQAAGSSYLANCRLEDNQAAGCGGGYGGAGGRAIWDQVVLQANRADGAGGGLAAGLAGGAGHLEMDHCRVTGNTAGRDGGGLWWGPAVSAQIANSLWTGNTAEDLGGGLYCAGSTATLRQMTISGNRTLQYHGGGLFAGQDSELTLRSCILWDNSAAGLGSELYLADPNAPSVLTGFNCCIRDQADCIYTEAACQVILDADSLSTDPNFVSPGYWHDSGTPAAGDDVWVFGGWELLPGSDCIDAGDPNGIESGETDLAGKGRWDDGAVDIGAFEAQRQELTLERLTLQASPDREAPQDAFSLTGQFLAFPQTFTQADFVTLRVGSWSETLGRERFRPAGKRQRYVYKGLAGGVTQLYLDFVSGQFRAAAKQVDLTGTTSPAPVVLAFGSYYGYAAAADAGADDLINAARPLPVKFLAGYADSLAVYQAAAETSDADTVARLSLQGAISLETPVDLCQTGVTICWGTDSFTLPAGSFVAKKNGKFVGTQKALAADPASAKVIIDQASCTFSILLRDTAIAWQDGPLLFGLAFGGYDQTAVAAWQDE